MYQMRFCLTTFCLILAWSVPLDAEAVTVYDNGGMTLLNAPLTSDFDPAHVMGAKQGADNFVLSSKATVDGLTFTGAYGFDNTAPAVDDFTVRIYHDAGGAPALNPFFEQSVGNITRSPTALNYFGFDIFEYETSIAPTLLDANQTYWLSIVNNTVGEGDNWGWASTADAGNSMDRLADGAAWGVASHGPWGAASSDGDLAFSLQGSFVPEPTTGALGLLGITGLVMIRRR